MSNYHCIQVAWTLLLRKRHSLDSSDRTFHWLQPLLNPWFRRQSQRSYPKSQLCHRLSRLCHPHPKLQVLRKPFLARLEGWTRRPVPDPKTPHHRAIRLENRSIQKSDHLSFDRPQICRNPQWQI